MMSDIRTFNIPFGRCFLSTVFLVLWAAVGGLAQEAGPQEEMIPEEAQQEQWSHIFQEAEKVFNSENQSACIAMFQDLISQLTEQKIRRTLTEPERILLLRSLDYLGQAFFLEGQPEESGRVFLKLIELDPNYRINEDLVSSKIIRFAEEIRSQNLGALSLTSDPPGATVKLDGTAVGTTNISALYSLKGDHDLEITKPGYFPQKQTISVMPGKTEKLTFILERSSSVAYFVTYPKGVEVLLEGKQIGITEGDPAERAERVSTEQNLPLSDFSAEFAVSDLQPGAYLIEFHKPCWETPPRKITILENKDYLFEPIVLVPSQAFLDITADDPQANIFIDNEYKGIAPKKVQVCSGKHVLKIKGPQGKFEKQVSVSKDQTMTISADLNPSLAFLGILGATNADELNARTIQKFSGLRTLNLQDSTSLSDQSVVTETLNQIMEGIRSNKPDPARKAKIQDLCGRVESDLLLVGHAQKDSGGEVVAFHLLSNWSSMADIRRIRITESGQWDEFQAELNHEEPLFEKRLGTGLIDTAITEGAVISRISLKTFEDSQPLQVGDVIVAIQEKPVTSTAETELVLQQMQSLDQWSLTVKRSGSPLTVFIRPISSPMEIQFDNPDLLFNRQLVHFMKLWNLTTDPLEKNIATLNIGLCYTHFGEYEEALNKLRQVELDREMGIGPGTARYRAAQCYQELGSIREAMEQLAEAARFVKNTVDSDDGPSLAREVERMQKALE